MRISEIVMVTGKVRTGKTNVATSLAPLAGHAVAAGCDIDARNL